ncbi:MAG: SLBB domain-containing protein [candidate division Zixibacteria bacterium]|nr:SLBB domain-containing protein [candidate division Zixibacteria bacterium]
MKKLKRGISLLLVIYLIFFQGLNLIWAQTEEKQEPIRNMAQDYYLVPGTNNQLLIKVNVWGEVLKPGIVEVPDNTDLLTLISMAGGPTENARLNKVKIVRNFSQNKTIKINLKDYVQNGKTSELPAVKPGDTVIIPRNSFHSVSKYITFLYNLAVIASVVKIFTD